MRLLFETRPNTLKLLDQFLVHQAGAAYEPAGYSYYLRGNVEVARVDDAFQIGRAHV
jgi:hypothetical protein